MKALVRTSGRRDAVKGALIAIEGIDGAGNTTQAKLLVRWLKQRGLRALLTKEPTRGDVGRLIRRRIRQVLLNPLVDALLFAADRAEHVTKVIVPKIEQGFIVVTDRYVESSIAYQGAEGADISWLEAINSFAPKPSLVVILDLQPSQALARKRKPREGFEQEEFLEKVRSILRARAREKGHLIVDASKPINEVQREIRKAVERLIKNQLLRDRWA
ncbi:MAG: dTMP kinase [Candidatus Nezhaarchaeota archaeon]|nr:dTMP kinase [Candidatus Nezhaarchaeota archaeon]